ncbi:uncharacterized protein LOC131264006 [Anopheles coustani]|uniref:uncharacterized protein LOC131264006 n=1 Tax=Anopheles coustani TaxID=139045 RepID=UPI00265A4FA1|nr:uncharacterized protein LOC131264006 [Anopheles coustani]
MLYLVTLVAVLLLSDGDCDRRYEYLSPLGLLAPVGGVEAYWREFPHLGAIGWTRDDGSVYWGCGGSLIWENFVLTAAHCVFHSDFNNSQPTVVRFGDLNLHNETDDQFVQQYNIVKIIRHPEHRFSAKYHDIALLMLENNIELHGTVVPACLWDDEEIRFTTLESAGWGATGYGESQTPKLLKVALHPVEKSVCDRHYRVGDRGLKQGLQEYQLCAGDDMMDTCQGDSGGPLEIKLLHSLYITPFIVAVTSFGSVCGKTAPGVYTKVTPYIPWIRSVLDEHGEDAPEWKFKPYGCALRYERFRPYDPVITGGLYHANGDYTFDFSRKRISRDFNGVLTTVKIGWNDTKDAAANCFGVLIDHNTVLTLAQCASYKGNAPSHIVLSGQGVNKIADIFIHPNYAQKTVYNNIAVLKLADAYSFAEKFVPACLTFSDAPSQALLEIGRGRVDLNIRGNTNGDILEQNDLDGNFTDLLAKVTPHAAVNCTLPKQYQPLLTKGLAEEHLCFGNDIYLVPEACEQTFGGGIQSKYFADSAKHTVYALNLLGRDCGFGESALGVKISSHAQWLSQVILKNKRRGDESALFFDTDLELGDHCGLPDGTVGMCTDIRRCPKVQYDLNIQKRVTFCSNGSIACCPFHNVLNATQGAGSELDTCSSQFRFVTEQYDLPYAEHDIDLRFPQVVEIQWNLSHGLHKSCIGTLISQSVAVSSASCLSRIGNESAEIIFYFETESLQMFIEKIIIHPKYDASTLRNDIGLVQISEIVESTIPACLWQNQTHTPLVLQQVRLSENVLKIVPSFSKYNSDCGDLGKPVGPTRFCADLHHSLWGATTESGAPAFWQELLDEDGTVVTYLVGIASESFRNYTILTRIESYVDWIKSHL